MLYYFVYFLMIAYLILVGKRALHMLQQNLYNENNRYLKWIKKNFKTTIINISLLGIVLSFLVLVLKNEKLISFVLLLLMLVYLISYFKEKSISSNIQNKKPLVYTARIKRLIVTLCIIYLLPMLFSLFTEYKNTFFFISTVITGFSFYTTYLALIINYPIEKGVYKHYESMAKSKLASMKDLKVIGITGSYGKTSSKNILNDILSIKFNTLATPKSLNTFNGLMITINNKLSKFDEVFIAEMGAYVRGEINGLCDLVNPKYGIITSIGTAHLETFGSEENILHGKMELIEHLPHDGVGVLNCDDPKQVSYKLKNNCKIIWIGIDNPKADVRASNIRTERTKTLFDVEFSGDKKKYQFETKLLGRHNIYNILSALALGYEFKIPIKDLCLAVRRVKPIEHRLEIKKIGNFYQIDDAYNSNPVGAKGALEVLGSIDGFRVVVTPGMIELGDKEYELNKEFGRQISKIANADLVILIGKKQTKPILDGLEEVGFSKSKIQVLNDVRESFTIINNLKEKKDIYALYENDLPDTYNE